MPGLGRHIWYIPGSQHTSPSSEQTELPAIDSPFPTSTPGSQVSLGRTSGPRAIQLAIYHAYLHLARIFDPTFRSYLHNGEPWAELGEALEILLRHGRDALVFNGLLDPLLLILRYEVIPIAELKWDRDDSSARDARGVAMVLNQWRALSDHVVVLGEEDTKTLFSTDTWILWSFLTYALEPRGTLCLEEMPCGSMSRPEKLDFPLYIELFKIPAFSVSKLDLSGNRLDHLPVQWLSGFPRLRILDITGCGLTCLPIYWLRTKIRVDGNVAFRRTPMGGHIIAHTIPIPARSRQIPSLVVHCLMYLRRSSNSKSNLSKMTTNYRAQRAQELILRSYICELCDTECATRIQDWMDKTMLYEITHHQGGIRYLALDGRICRPCFEFLTTPPPVELV